MENKDSKISIMRNDPIPRALLKLGVPTMIGMMVSALYSVVDAYFVGGLGTAQMGAIAIVFPVVQVIIGLGMMFGSGAASYISRLLGAGEYEEANQTASTALISSLAVGLLCITGALVFLDPLLLALGSTETILPYAHAYAVIYIAGSILNIFNVTMNNLVTAEGATKLTMASMLTGGILNVALDPIFIYTLGFGVQGAAIATVVAQGVTSCIYFWYLSKKKGVLQIKINNCLFNGTIYKEIFSIGMPILIFQLLASAALGLTNTASSPYGDSAVAAMGAVARIITLGTYVIFGFMKGYQPLVGYNFGARNFKRLKEATKHAFIWTTAFCVIVAAFMIFMPEGMISIFTKSDSSLVEIGSVAVRAYGYIMPFFGFEMLMIALFLALGYGKEGGILSISRQGIFFIPAILILPKFWGINGVIWTQPVAEALTVLLTMALTIPFIKKVQDRIQSENFIPE